MMVQENAQAVNQNRPGYQNASRIGPAGRASRNGQWELCPQGDFVQLLMGDLEGTDLHHSGVTDGWSGDE